MAIKDLKTQMDKIVINTEQRMLNVVTKAIDDTVEDAQTPTGDGGRMRVDTGFLRFSGAAALNAAPTGPGRGDRKGRYTWNGEALNAVLARMKIGDAFYWGWTAKYARVREAYDGFLEIALQNWQTRVDAAVNYYRKKDGK